MPVSVDQPSKVIASSANEESISISVVSGSETKFVSNTPTVNKISISVSEASGVSVSSSDVINISLVDSSSENNISVTSNTANNVSISNAIGSGPTGETGPQGPQGDQGPSGADGTVSNLSSIPDVTITSVADDQILIYDAASGEWLNEDIPTASLDQEIAISNNDNAFSHISSPIVAGTSLEEVLRKILIKYNRTTITLNNLSVQKQSSDDSYASAANVSSSETLEVGRGIKVISFNITIGDNTQVTDNSVDFLKNNSPLETGFSDTNGTKTLSSSDDTDPTSETSLSYKVRAIDDGGADLPDQNIFSSTITFSWRYRVRVGASSTSSLSDAADAAALFTGMSLAYDQLRGELDFNVTANSAMDLSGNYTWISYPAAFGNLNKIDLAGVDVLSDFESPVDFNITNDYGKTISYRFYRSTYDDAFAQGQIITIDF